MSHKKLAIGAIVVAIAAVFLFVFVPVIPITAHCPGHVPPGLLPPTCVYASYAYYGSISYYVSGVGMTYQGIPTGFQWSPNIPRS
jgi:hypothetical protein